jgi:hypothetical protein
MRPDVRVHQWTEPRPPRAQNVQTEEPDVEIAVATLDPGKCLLVESGGRLVSAVELISPRNKDRPVARTTYVSRYVGYLIEGIHLLLTDVHPRPVGFSFADAIAEQLEIAQPSCPVPFAVSYRVGEPAASGGRLLGIWRRELVVGESLPTIALPLTTEISIPVDLEHTYRQAAADAYID